MTTVVNLEVPLGPLAHTEGYSYTEATYCVSKMILKAISNGNAPRTSYDEILLDVAAVESIKNRVKPQLRAKKRCKTVQDRMEYFLFRLNSSFVISALCRPALSRKQDPAHEIRQKELLAEKCKQNLTETLRMYLQMHSLGITPTRSWAITHNGISSALLLGILGETKTNPEVRDLQGRLINVLSSIASNDREFEQDPADASEITLTEPHSRALTALRNIYDHGSLIGPQPAPKESTTMQGNESILADGERYLANRSVASENITLEQAEQENS